ncbi:MAG: membrane protein insertase YidC [Flavobacteriales bacterium]|nr:membrane protein insertase YidC [Flavobacteriales bacterium]MCB9447605.1 membrane protein insertase YidC [Flavobacteriales bacterium]
MDRNSIIGLTLIGLIMVVFSIMNRPSEEELAAQKSRQDSIAAVEQEKKLAEESAQQHSLTPEANSNAVQQDTTVSDSVKAILRQNEFGVFADATVGEEKLITIENDKVRLVISTRGGRMVSAELKEYHTYDSLPLYLFTPDRSSFNMRFAAGTRVIATNDLYFTPGSDGFSVNAGEKNSISFRASAGQGKYIEYTYGLTGGSYVVDFNINMVGLDQVIAANTNFVDLNWEFDAPRQEKNVKTERRNTSVYYHYMEDGETDHLSTTKEDQKDLEAKSSWVAMKSQFFTAALMSKEGLDKPLSVEVKPFEEKDDDEIHAEYLKTLKAEMSIPYDHKASENHAFQFYFGPNHYKTLKDLDVGMENIIYLGWGVFKWVNKFLVIPVFNYLDSFDLSYGLIILLLTVLIKSLLFPLTYRTYLSSAKMRVLKPDIEELGKKFKPEDTLKKQQATMALYRQAGVNPLGGCIPTLLQMPILYAMFSFFPASIELRQQPFLWAKDLSTYDSVLQLPFHIPGYGDHVSLFTLLMTASIFATMKYNTGQYGSNDQMGKQMKIMMYVMPVFFMGFLNNYSSGLTYYYFLSNMITFLQQQIFRRFVDDDAIHKKIQENKKKPASQKKSKFQERMDEMMKQRGYQPPKR